MTAIEQKIEDLGTWAAELELCAADPANPYWIREKSYWRAKDMRDEQMRLLEKAATYPLPRCATDSCKNVSIGSPYCARCEEEINGRPYPLANIILGETFVQYVTRLTDRFFGRNR